MPFNIEHILTPSPERNLIIKPLIILTIALFTLFAIRRVAAVQKRIEKEDEIQRKEEGL